MTISNKLMEAAMHLRAQCSFREEAIYRQAGVSQAEFCCLRVLPRDTGLAAGELATAMGISPSRGTRVVDGLVRRGLAKRVGSDRDRRVNVICATPEGLRIKDEIDRHLRSCEEALRAHLTEQEQAHAALGMKLMLEALSHTESDL